MSYAPSLTRSGTARTMPNHRAASAYIRARVPFKSGSLTGHRNAAYGLGYLRSAWHPAFYDDANTIDYVVYSYSTPIAWHTPQGWTVPRETYSVTTSGKHMGPLWSGIPRGERVRTRIDAVTVVATNRLNNSVNGNPRYEVQLSDGRIALTSSDAAVSYDVSNAARDQRPRYVEFTPAGRISSWTIAPADNFSER